MKNYVFLFFFFLLSLPISAQLDGDGYYRVQNKETERFIRIRDGYGRIDIASTSADMSAVLTVKPFEAVADDPASIIYISKVSDAYGDGRDGYNLFCQGTSTYNIIGYYLLLWTSSDGSYYRTYATKAGIEIYLSDENHHLDEGGLVTNSRATRDWYIHPVKSDGLYLGVTPSFSIGSKYYTHYFTSFPYSFVSPGMAAYYIRQIDARYGVAVKQPVTTADVPAEFPVFIECSSDNCASNRLDVHSSSVSAPADNILKGVYFRRVQNNITNPHNAYVKNDTSTMRVLGVTSSGKLGFIVSQEEYLPENSAYLSVPASSPAEYVVMSESEYEEFLEVMSLKSVSDEAAGKRGPRRVYNVIGTCVREDADDLEGLPAGVYFVDGKKFILK